MDYKGCTIDTSAIYGDKVSVEIEGCDMLFDSVEQAKKYINEEL